MTNTLPALTDLQRDVATIETKKYKHVWENCSTYGDKHHDVDLWERHKDDYGFDLDPIDGAGVNTPPSIVVLGCGDGSLVRSLVVQGFNAVGVDIFDHPLWGTVNNGKGKYSRIFRQQPLWDKLPVPGHGGKWDLAICADVLEHIPVALLHIVLMNISNSCKAGLFQIANMDSSFGGYNLHMIKEGPKWWLMQMLMMMDGELNLGSEKGLPYDSLPHDRFVIKWEDNESTKEI